jgi:hypothetical protein
LTDLSSSGIQHSDGPRIRKLLADSVLSEGLRPYPTPALRLSEKEANQSQAAGLHTMVPTQRRMGSSASEEVRQSRLPLGEKRAKSCVTVLNLFIE